MSKNKKILIVQNKFIGDVLASSVMANVLKEDDPNIVVHFFCYQPAWDVLQGNPNIDRVISFKKGELKNYNRLLYFARLLKNEKYDVIIDPYAKLESYFITKFCSPKMSISFDKTLTRLLYTNPIKRDYKLAVGRCTALADRVNMLKPVIGDKLNEPYKMEIFLSEKEKETGKEILREANLDLSKKTLMMGVIGSGLDKTWPLDYMAQLINEITNNYNYNLLFNYVPNQQKWVNELMLKLNNKEQIFSSVLGKNVREFLTLMANCDAYIGNEGGGINMSKGLGKPTFSIYSPHKTPESWGCLEYMDTHRSVCLKKLLPDVYKNSTQKDRLKHPEKYYIQMKPKLVIPKVLNFINQVINE